MKEYIDRKALLKTIFPYDVADKSEYAINAKAVEKAIKGATTADVVEVVRKAIKGYEGYYEVDQFIENQPTADVEEVKRGEWVPYEQPLGIGYSTPNYKPTHYCSNCEGLGWEFFKRCPHCGAKMDGKRKEQE